MEQEIRNKLQRVTQQIRQALEHDFAQQLEGTFDILPDGTILPAAGRHLDVRQTFARQKLVDAIKHIIAGGKRPSEAVTEYVREASFTFLNRFIALRMLESRELVQECVSKGDRSTGFKEFCGLAPGLSGLPDSGYRLYLECLFDELDVEIKILFDRRDAASILWPAHSTLNDILKLLGDAELSTVWGQDDTIGWVYQYFNSTDERRKMRESQAPQNSRELAVRNQFFTPRYVVQFLTDNTLGRIWYEMRKGNTQLSEQCQYMVKYPGETFIDFVEDLDTSTELTEKTVGIAHRPKKDPRDIRVLDPACGSGHFLLYAFDLLAAMYEEAWHDLESPKAEKSGRSLREDYPTLDRLRAELPNLILRHNLHGVDIDPRACQIAVLSLWMRAQRLYKHAGIAREHRAVITKSNIVCAESMPGEQEILNEFIENNLHSVDHELLGNLLRGIFAAMRPADEIGSLLRIETYITEALSQAKRTWQNGGKVFQKSLLNPFHIAGEPPDESGLAMLDDDQFWANAEQRLYSALRQFEEGLTDAHKFQRRLFAEDTGRGLAFIDLCRLKYDTILMNPPFGEATKAIYDQGIKPIDGTSREVASLFVSRCIQLLQPGGRLGVLATRMLMFLDLLDDWRKQLLSSFSFGVVADFGIGVLDAVVDTAAMVISEGEHDVGMFVNLLSSSRKQADLLDSVKAPLNRDDVHIVESTFQDVPGNRIAYWAPRHWLKLFRTNKLKEYATVSKGLETGDDERFMRLHVEVPSELIDERWLRCSKGGEYQPFAGNIELVLDGRLIPVARRKTDANLYGVGGITYTQRTTSFLSFRALPEKFVFTPGGPGIIPTDRNRLRHLISCLSSRPFGSLVELCVGSGDSAVRGGSARNYTAGILRQIPTPITKLSKDDLRLIEESTDRRFRCVTKHHLATDEVCPLFYGFADLAKYSTVKELALVRSRDYVLDALEVLRTDYKADVVWRRAYGFTDEDSAALDKDFAQHPESAISLDIPDGFWDDPAKTVNVVNQRRNRQFLKNSYIIHEKLETASVSLGVRPEAIGNDERFWEWCAEPLELSKALFSYLFGIAIGRWDIQQLHSGATLPTTDPFAGIAKVVSPLLCSPTKDYPLSIPADGLLVDDPGHPLDLSAAIRQVAGHIWDDKADGMLASLCEQLSCNDINDYVRKRFFAHHIDRYSRRPRVAPIFWQLATPSAAYSVWLYYPKLDRDTFFKVRRDLVRPKLEHERQRLTRLKEQVGTAGTRAQQRDIEEQEKVVGELAAFADEIDRIAPMWSPDLSDGVMTNFAPLWRLVPHNKPWQDSCKSTWDKITKGECDWSSLSAHLWPERVVPACTKDPGLSLSHGLTNYFWQLDDRNRYQPIQMSSSARSQAIDELIGQRTSSAVKAALNSLLESSVPAAKTVRSKRKKVTI